MAKLRLRWRLAAPVCLAGLAVIVGSGGPVAAATRGWSFVAPLTIARPAVGDSAAPGPDGRTYVVGGDSDQSGSTAEAYDPSLNTWTRVADLPTTSPGPVYGAAFVTDNNLMYLIGGSHDGEPTSAVTAYDTTHNAWASVSAMSTPRTQLAAVSAGGNVYAIGGAQDDGSGLATVEVYNPTQNQWTAATSMPQPRIGPATVADGSSIYVFGGYNPSDGAVADSERYDLADGEWHSVAPIPTPVQGAGAAIGDDGRIYVVGGATADGLTPTGPVQIYDPASDTWSSGPDLADPRAFFGLATDRFGDILAIGGSADAGHTDPSQTVEALPGPAPKIVLLQRYMLDQRLTADVPPHVSVSLFFDGATTSRQGICSYSLDESVNGGPYTTVPGGHPPEYENGVSVVTGTPASPMRYSFALYANGCNHQVSKAAIVPPFAVTAVPENSSKIVYSDGWTRARSPDAVGGHTKYATQAGASLSYTFTGTQIGLVAPIGPTEGRAQVFIDGALSKGKLNLYSTDTESRLIRWRHNFRTRGKHTVKIVVVGAGTHPRIDVDGFVVFG